MSYYQYELVVLEVVALLESFLLFISNRKRRIKKMLSSWVWQHAMGQGYDTTRHGTRNNLLQIRHVCLAHVGP